MKDEGLLSLGCLNDAATSEKADMFVGSQRDRSHGSEGSGVIEAAAIDLLSTQ